MRLSIDTLVTRSVIFITESCWNAKNAFLQMLITEMPQDKVHNPFLRVAHYYQLNTHSEAVMRSSRLRDGLVCSVHVGRAARRNCAAAALSSLSLRLPSVPNCGMAELN